MELLLRWGSDVSLEDDHKLTALHWAIVRGSRKCVKHLLQHGASLSAKTQDGKSALDLAQEMNCSKMVASVMKELGVKGDGKRAIPPFSEKITNKVIFLIPIPMLYGAIWLLSQLTLQISLIAAIAWIVFWHYFATGYIMRTADTITAVQSTVCCLILTKSPI